MSEANNYPGCLLMVIAPSGAGKSSLVRALLEQDKQIQLSISFTTRSPRPQELNGREYHFISEAEFKQRQVRDEFLEYAQVHGNYYGTSQVWIEEQIAKGRDIILEIDWQGAKQVKQKIPQAFGVFILPPSYTVLSERLRKRAQDAEEIIAKRLQDAHIEIAHAPEFEYVIVNEDFNYALADIASILQAERCRASRRLQQHAELFKQLITN